MSKTRIPSTDSTTSKPARKPRVLKMKLRVVTNGDAAHLVRAKSDKAAVAHIVGSWTAHVAEVEEAAELLAKGTKIEEAAE